MQRYINNKFWAMKPSNNGQYVAYHEVQETIDRLRADRDEHIKNNNALWEGNIKLQEEIKELNRHYENYTMLDDKYWSLRDSYEWLAVACTVGWLGWVGTVVIVVVLRGGV